MRRWFPDQPFQQELEETGFVRLRLFERSEAAALLDVLMRSRNGRQFEASAVRDQVLTYHTTALDEDLAFRRIAYETLKQAVAPRLSRLLDPFRIVSAGLVVKPPGTGALELHTDPTLTRDPDEVALTVWCPFVDVDQANGGLRVIPGSHRLVRQINGPGIREYMADYEPELREMSVPVDLASGEAVIFDNTLVHGSPANRSPVPRPVMMLGIVPEECEPVFYTTDPAGRARLQMFDMSDGCYLDYSPSDYFAGRVAERRAGSIPNRNERPSLRQFKKRLARGARSRRQHYAPRRLVERLFRRGR